MDSRSSKCAYCGDNAIHMDHVLPLQMIRRYDKDAKRFGRPPIPSKWLITAPSCGPCNWRKLTSRLLPPSWEKWVDEINSFFGGVKFRTWKGGTIPEPTR